MRIGVFGQHALLRGLADLATPDLVQASDCLGPLRARFCAPPPRSRPPGPPPAQRCPGPLPPLLRRGAPPNGAEGGFEAPPPRGEENGPPPRPPQPRGGGAPTRSPPCCRAPR